jgi:hypothetical protein
MVTVRPSSIQDARFVKINLQSEELSSIFPRSLVSTTLWIFIIQQITAVIFVIVESSYFGSGHRPNK